MSEVERVRAAGAVTPAVEDVAVLRADSRLRLRALALIHGAMGASHVSKAELARRLGVGRSAVNSTLKGNGNVTLRTLSEYVGVLGFELDLLPTRMGEVAVSIRERRAPRVAELTLRDRDLAQRGGVHAVAEVNRSSTSHGVLAGSGGGPHKIESNSVSQVSLVSVTQVGAVR
ncbi:helix-turn-helix domain-containing protein [Microbacterium sp.]|uniref:helix-turn-helix domain-containing protein n=1 Tax=Microbacterium sp. TaxID=51671 RepID=UPI0039E5848F